MVAVVIEFLCGGSLAEVAIDLLVFLLRHFPSQSCPEKSTRFLFPGAIIRLSGGNFRAKTVARRQVKDEQPVSFWTTWTWKSSRCSRRRRPWSQDEDEEEDTCLCIWPVTHATISWADFHNSVGQPSFGPITELVEISYGSKVYVILVCRGKRRQNCNPQEW